MELFSVIIPAKWGALADRLYVRLSLEANQLHKIGQSVRFHCESFPTHAAVRCEAVLPGFNLSESGSGIYRFAAETLASFIMDQMENMLIRDIISGPYKYEDPAEIEAIGKYCDQVLHQGESEAISQPSRLRRQSKIADAICAYLEEHTDLHLEGFIRFRLKDYTDELREVAEYAIDEYIMEQQYQEFISLLKYFVYIQDTKIPVAHLIHHGGSDFTIYNEQMMPIDSEMFEGFTLELLDKEINFEDMIVSTLISVSPSQIVIHTREPEEQSIKTIVQIFEERATVCHYCKHCASAFVSGKNHDQLYP